MSQTNDLLTAISEKMDKMLRLLAIDVVKGYNKEVDKIDLLDSIGFRPIEIAKFLNKSQDNVNNRLNEIRKNSEFASGKPKGKATETQDAKTEDTS